MIRFFRKMRKHLLSENKISRYLLYAIGEIVLVVLGILIAVQINTWNENKKKSNKERTYLSSLEDDFKLQIQAINTQIEKEKSYINSAKYVLDILNQTQDRSREFDKTFYDHLTNLTSRKTFRSVEATYTDLVSTGELSLISNAKIKNDIVVYYQELELTESVIQNNNTKIVDDIFLPKVQDLAFYYRNRNYLDSLEFGASSDYLNYFDTHDAAYSSNLILEPHNSLILKNILKQRLLVATYHDKMLNEMRVKTDNLANIISAKKI